MKLPTYTTITIGSRTAILHTPPTPGAWLLLCTHPSGSTGRSFANVTQFAALADTANFYCVFPDAIGGQWNPSTPADLDFLTALVAQLKATYTTIEHIGMVGYSNGAEMAATVALVQPFPVEALACCSGGLSNELLKQYGIPTTPVTFISFWGTADTTWQYAGWGTAKFGQGLLGAQDNFSIWQQTNGCTDETPAAADVSGLIDKLAAGDVLEQTASDGTDDTRVTLYSCKGNGHTWPGAKQSALSGVLGTTNTKINATQLVWQFFSATVPA